MSQRHLDVFGDENSNEAPRPDDSCRSNVAPTQMFAKISARTRPFAVALADFVSTLPPEAVLEEAARELPRAVTAGAAQES